MTKRRRDPVYSVAIGLGLSLFRFWRLKRRVTGRENIPDAGGAILAMTHFGYLEFALVEWAVWSKGRRHIRFLATKSAFEKPVVGSLLRGMRHIPVDRAAGSEAYRETVTALRDGELVGVFPEAGVSASFTVRELKTGAARLAAEARVPIIPVAVWGGQRLMTKGRRVRFRDRFGVAVHFAFGAPITVRADDDVATVTHALRERMQSLTDALQSSYPLQGTGQWWQPRHLGGTAPTPAEARATEAERMRRRQQKAHMPTENAGAEVSE